MATMGEAHSCTGRTLGTMELSNTKWAVRQVVISLSLKSFSYGLATHPVRAAGWAPALEALEKLSRHGCCYGIVPGAQ